MQHYLTKFLLVAVVVFPAVSMGGVISTDYAFAVNYNYLQNTFEQTVDASQEKSSITAVNQFDASLGTLTDAKISFTSNFSYLAQAQSRDTQHERSDRRCGWSSCSTYYYYDDDVSVSAVLSQDFAISLENYAGVGVNLDNTYQRDCERVLDNTTSSQCTDYGNGWESMSYATELDLSGVDLSSLIGGGTLDMTFLNTNSTSGTCASNDEVYCYTYNYVYGWNGTITVEYTYEEAVSSVSEPSGLALFVFSIPALWLVRRRSNSKA